NRLPPNNAAYLDAVGLDPRLLDMFYTEGLEAMPPAARKEFVGKMQQLYAILALPAGATVQEWNEAKNASYGMKATLAREFGDAEGDLDNIYELQNTYFDISDPEAAAEFLNQHAILAEYWDRRRELIMADPLLQKYMASMDMFERVARDDFNRRMD